MITLDFKYWFIILVFSYILLLSLYLQFSDRRDTLNNILSFMALSFVFIHVLLFLYMMFDLRYIRIHVLPLWSAVLGLSILIIGFIALISTGIKFLFKFFKVKRNFSKLEKRWKEKYKNYSKARIDTSRKISHVLIFIGLFIVWYVGFCAVIATYQEWVSMIPEDNNTLGLYFTLLSEPESIYPTLYILGWFYYLIFFFFYVFCIFMLMNEVTRKTPYLAFPFNFFSKLLLNEHEKQSYGTYLYFAIGQMFAAFVCPPMVLFAILGISSIGDLMTSQIGIRRGKHHLKWNQDKTWEGTIAGTIISMILSYFFVGFIWASIFTICFFIFDIITNRPLKLSDNLLNPIGCALIYITIRFFFDLNYISPLLEMIY